MDTSLSIQPNVKYLWSISYPLMLSNLLATAVLLLDRVMLAQYSIEVMNAISIAGITYSLFLSGCAALTASAEIFVGQYNGASQFNKISEVIWQMIWFSLFLIIIFWPAALFLGHYTFPLSLQKVGIPYFQWIMFFGFLPPIIVALSAFFIGRGKTKLVTFIAFIGFITKVLFNSIFIFGIKEIIPSLEAVGAALSTILSQIIQIIILMSIFLNHKNHKIFNTRNFNLKINLLWKSLKIGVPFSLSRLFESGAWLVITQIVAATNLNNLTIQNVSHSMFLLFIFLPEGLHKGVAVISANLLGSHQRNFPLLIRSYFKIYFIIMLLFSIPILIYPEIIIRYFLPGTEPTSLFEITGCNNLFKWLWGFLVVYGIFRAFEGILVGGGDTKFIMYNNTLNFWITVIIPTYICITYYNATPIVIWKFCFLYSLINVFIYVKRFLSTKWSGKFNKIVE